MSVEFKKKVLAGYMEEASYGGFFASFFRPEYFDTETVEFDIEREGREIAPVLSSFTSGGQLIKSDEFSNKEITPTAVKLIAQCNALQALKRSFGENEYAPVNVVMSCMRKTMKDIRKGEKMIRRTIEVMCSQVMQTGKVSLMDENGNVEYTIDFKPKAAHFPTSSVAWDQAGADFEGDIQSLAEQVRVNGKGNPNTLIFGEKAWHYFSKSDFVKQMLDIKNITLGGIQPRRARDGAIFKGVLWLGNYEYEMWTYPDSYNAIKTGIDTKYMDPIKVVVLDWNARLEVCYGTIPVLKKPDQQIMQYLPSIVRGNRAQNIQMSVNGYFNQDGTAINLMVGTRPIAIPVSIDKFGCLNTGITG